MQAMVITANTVAAAFTGAGSNQASTEWARPPKNGQHLEGLSRSYIYRLIESGSLKSMSLITPGAKKGVRLIHVPSLREWLATQAEKQEGGAA